ncbi:esterase FE4-like [Bradysia coprophila]|uniref:esterase FE4-like n=1 Tax=Bradysia coprophila TaxID=38358 RepID=UPI00187D8BAA|nr:esterase FE4-like [Bradysia coprophila]
MKYFTGQLLGLGVILGIMSLSEQVRGNNYPEVVTSLGTIKGTMMTSYHGKSFSAFRGIRYAQPPVAELRFKPPMPVHPWTDTFDATDDGPMCPQPFANQTLIDEDCLRLNIYTNNLPATDKLKSVLVYLHPGGFWAVGSSSQYFAGPNYLMDNDLVFVSLNYRLGSLGFMSTGTAESPGNNGLKDQVMALKFLRSHIEKFGGNPNDITLMGYSAGAMSISMHLVSPMSVGLFHKAIVMSSAATGQWENPVDQLHLAKKQARIFNCPDDNVDDMIECLRKVDGNEFGIRLKEMFEVFDYQPTLLWIPVVEPDFGQERFLVEDPTLSFYEGRFQKIPIISGIIKLEFAQYAISTLTNTERREQMESNWETLAPICFQYERDTERSKNISRALRKAYLDFPLTDERALEGLNLLYADGLIIFSVLRFIRLASRHTPVYSYMNTYVGNRSHTYYPDDKTPYGPVHHDDLIYLITGKGVVPEFDTLDSKQVTKATGQHSFKMGTRMRVLARMF